MGNVALEQINQDLERQRGISRGYPKCLSCNVTEKSTGIFNLCVSGDLNEDDVWQRADPWGFAIWVEILDVLDCVQLGLHFDMPEPKNRPKYEAFKRRLSYLAEMNREMSIVLSIGGRAEELYSISDLMKRPENEIIHKELNEPSPTNVPGFSLEKDFQVYLYAKSQGIRDNQRLALLGDDFFNIRSLNFGVLREFATGAFDGKVTEEKRLLPTEYVDLVTINKHKEIAIIELKFGSKPLEAISQLLNYALYFYSYKAQLTQLISSPLGFKCADRPIKAYLVSDVFHARFNDVWPYYSRGPIIAMRKVVMGYMP